MSCKIEKRIEELRRRIDALAASGDVSEENIRRRNILTVKLDNLKKQNNPWQSKAHSYGYELQISMRQIEGLTDKYVSY